MVMRVTMAADSSRAARMRADLAGKLVADGMITSPLVEAAFRAVSRHEFVPASTPLEAAYNAADSVVTKKDENGADVSSVSAPFIQALMIRQAGLGPGMSVLEIGSGGYNAALLAEVTGEAGRVVSVDIDPEVTQRAAALLAAAGYAGRVTVVLGDGERGVPGYAPYDAILVTAGAWDIPPAWLTQLASTDGTLVVPLRMNGVTRSIAFRRADPADPADPADCADGHLVSASAEVCGFVPMQGAAARAERVVRLADPRGGHVMLRFDDGAPGDAGLLDGALAAGPVTVWSEVTIGDRVSFADLHLWLAGFLPGFCRVAASEGTALAAEQAGKGWFPFGAAHGDSFSYLAVRKTGGRDGAEFEFGARAYGPHGPDAAEALAAQIRAWDSRGRDLRGDAFAFWPDGTSPGSLPESTAVFRKSRGTVTCSWPAG
jgi:protein-L-isoaspartate(D-aspartate) O-methyltransferase